jgi:two-component system cell cycle response regulator DivK
MQVTKMPVRADAPTVLLAEDHEDTRRVYSMLLRHYGYIVAEAATGREAVDSARALAPDLILMDIGMPVLDGREAARLIKADPATHDIPVLAFSAFIDSPRDLSSDIGTFDGFISKPVSPRELARQVGEAMGPDVPPAAGPPELR